MDRDPEPAGAGEPRAERRPRPEPAADRPASSSLPRRDAAGLGAHLGLGLQFVASVVVFLYLGQWLDRRLGTAPWLLLVGVFVGAGGSFYSIYRRLMRDLHRSSGDHRRRPPTEGAP